MSFWKSNDVYVIPCRDNNNMGEKYQLVKELGYQKIHFIVNCSPQQMLKELIHPTEFDPNLDYYVSDKTEPTRKLKGKLPNGDILEWKHSTLLCNTKPVCDDCFLKGRVLLKRYCTRHRKNLQSTTSEEISPTKQDVIINDVEIDEKTIKIPLKNKNHKIIAYALADKEDENRLSKLTWYKQKNGYVQAGFVDKLGRRTAIMMHRFILNSQPGSLTDHRNHNRQDNRKANLGTISPSENNHNKTKNPNSSSKYFGVSIDKQNKKKKWQASCKKEFLGNFAKEEWAAYAYDQGAIRLFGDKAQINNIAKPDNFVAWKQRSPTNNVEIDGKKAKGLSIVKRNNKECFRLSLRVNGVVHNKVYKDINEAKTAYIKLRNVIDTTPKPVINMLRNSQGIAILPCTNTFGVLVDDDTFFKYSSQKCNLSAIYPSVLVNGKSCLLHRLVTNAQVGEIVDHIDRDPLNAQFDNLRIVDSSTNAHNRTKLTGKSSKFIGVHKSKDKYRVCIMKNGITHDAGLYDCEKVAGWTADQLSKELFGIHARTNNVKLTGYVFANKRTLPIETNTLISKRQKIEK